MEKHRIIDFLEKTKTFLISEEPHTQTGICKAMENTFYFNNEFSRLDYDYMIQYVNFNKPNKNNQYSEFISSYWVDNRYWWIPIYKEQQTQQVRIRYIQQLIDNLK